MCISDGLRFKDFFPPSQGSCSLTLQTQASSCVLILGEKLEGAAEGAEMIQVQLLVSTNQRLG